MRAFICLFAWAISSLALAKVAKPKNDDKAYLMFFDARKTITDPAKKKQYDNACINGIDGKITDAKWNECVGYVGEDFFKNYGENKKTDDKKKAAANDRYKEYKASHTYSRLDKARLDDIKTYTSVYLKVNHCTFDEKDPKAEIYRIKCVLDDLSPAYVFVTQKDLASNYADSSFLNQNNINCVVLSIAKEGMSCVDLYSAERYAKEIGRKQNWSEASVKNLQTMLAAAAMLGSGQEMSPELRSQAEQIVAAGRAEMEKAH